MSLAAFLTAYLVHPLLAWSQRRFHAQWLGLALFFLALALMLGLTASLVYGLAQQVVGFSQTLPALLRAVTGSAADVPQLIRTLPVPASFQPQLADAYRAALGQLGNLTSGLSNGLESFVLGGGLVGSLSAITNSLIDLFALLALMVYTLLSLPQVTRFPIRVFPKPYQPTAKDVVDKFEF